MIFFLFTDFNLFIYKKWFNLFKINDLDLVLLKENFKCILFTKECLVTYFYLKKWVYGFIYIRMFFIFLKKKDFYNCIYKNIPISIFFI